MTILGRIARTTAVTTGATILLAAWASAETKAVGVVASLQGTATVQRASTPHPAPLRFKDDVFVRDRITTGERSVVRILFGGKATVTAREHSVLVITERPGASTVNLTTGRIAVAVDKTRVKPGEIVEIRTPNAVAAIRGTVVVAEVTPDLGGSRSTITVLRGLIDVARLDASGWAVGRAVDVGALQQITVTRTLSPIQTITPDDAKQLSRGFSVIPKHAPSASMEPLVKAAVENTARELEQLVAPVEAVVVNAARGGEDVEREGGTTSGTAGASSSSGVGGASASASGVAAGGTDGGTGSGGGSTSSAVAGGSSSVPGNGNAYGVSGNPGGGNGSGSTSSGAGSSGTSAVPGGGNAYGVSGGNPGNGNSSGARAPVSSAAVSVPGGGNAFGLVGGGRGNGNANTPGPTVSSGSSGVPGGGNAFGAVNGGPANGNPAKGNGKK